MSSSPFASYRSQPARPQHKGRAARPVAYSAYKPPRCAGSSSCRTVLIVLAVVFGVPAALALLLGLIVTGVATIPAIGGVVVALVICQPKRGARQQQQRRR